jgi:hypothetical protein
MAFTRQPLDRRRLDRPIDGHSVPIGSRLVLAPTAALALHTLGPRPGTTVNHACLQRSSP